MSYSAFGFVDRPLNPSGLPSVKRRYSAVGMERELGEVEKALSAFLQGQDNILAVIIGPYGWGKTELLDASQELIEGRGIKVVRLSLSIGLDFNIMGKILDAKRGNKHLVVMLDEADELTRLVSISGGINDDVKRLIVNMGTIMRALLEPRNYAHQLGIDAADLSGVMVIAAFTPHLYYNILKSNVPDLFDITKGRVYREIIMDERFPYWLYEAIISNRLEAYSTQSFRDLKTAAGGGDLWPLTREALSFLYLAAASGEGGTVTPRNMMKLTAKLLDRVVESGRQLTVGVLASFALDELKWIDSDLLKELLETYSDLSILILSGIPVSIDALGVSPQALAVSGIAEEVLVAEIDPGDSKAVAGLNGVRMLFGLLPIAFKDLRDLSIEYGSHYPRYSGGRVVLNAVLPTTAEEELRRLGIKYVRAYELKKDIHRAVFKQRGSAGLGDVEPVMRELAQEGAPAVLKHLIRLISGSAQLGAQGNIVVNVSEQSLDARLGFLGVEWSPTVERMIDEAVLRGEVRMGQSIKPVDGLILIAASSSLLTRDLEDLIRRSLSKLRWKDVFPVDGHVMVIPMGSDKLDEARQTVMGLALMGKPNPPAEYRVFVERARAFLDRLNSFKEELRSDLLRYTIGMRRRESKREGIRRIVEQWVSGDVRDLPDSFKCGDKPCISLVEQVVLDYLNRTERQVTQRELESIIAAILPVQLWREFREGDLIQLMRMRGLLIQVGDKLLPISPQSFKAGIDAMCKELDGIISSYGEEQATIEFGDWRLQVRLPGSGELMRRTQGMRDDCNVLAAVVKPGEDELKKYASLRLALDDMEEALNEARESLGNELGRAKSSLESCASLLNSLGSELDRHAALLPPSIMDILRSKSNELALMIADSIRKLNGMSLDAASKSLEAIVEDAREESAKILEVAKSISSILSIINEYRSLTETARRLSKLVEDWMPSLEDVDMDGIMDDLIKLAKMGVVDQLNEIYADLSNKVKQARGSLTTGIERAREVLMRYSNAAKWLEAKAVMHAPIIDLGPVDQDGEEQLDRLIKIKTDVDAKLREIAVKLNAPLPLIRYIAFKGPNVGIDEIEAGRSLGMESQQVINYLEVLWRAKLVEKKYVS